MKKIRVFLFFWLCFIFSPVAFGETPIELRPKFTKKWCDTVLAKASACIDWEYFLDEVELVVDNSIYNPLPQRIEDLSSVRRAIGEGVAEEYEFYLDRFIKQTNLGTDDINLLREVGLDKIARIRFKNIKTQGEMGKWLAVFSQDYNVVGIYFSSVIKTVDHTDDPLTNDQWYLEKENFHEAHNDSGFGSPEIVTTIFDTGYDPKHKDLPPLAGWYDHLGNSKTPYDVYGHGTAVSGVLMQIPNNNFGGVGTSPGVSLWVRKILDDNGTGKWDTFAEAVIAQTKVCKSLREENPNVRCTFNFSLQGLGPVPSVDAALNFAYKEGIIGVAAAGNFFVSLDRVPIYPAAKKGTIPVSALTKDDKLAGFSAYGIKIPTVAAGGVGIVTAVPGSGSNASSSGYKTWQGTSFASPQVVGAINLAWSKKRHLSSDQIRILTVGSSTLIPGLEAYVTSGGRINASMMLESAISIPEMPVNFKITSASHISIETSHIQIGRVLGYVYYISEDPFDEAIANAPNVTAIQVIKPNLAGASIAKMTFNYLEEKVKYFLAVRSFDRFGNTSSLSSVLEVSTKKSQLFAERTFNTDSGSQDPGQWFQDYGPLPVGDALPWHLSNVLRSSGGATRYNWRFGRENSLDYYTVLVSDALLKSEVFDLRSLRGASASFDYFQITSIVDLSDFCQVYAVTIDNAGRETDFILLKEYHVEDNSRSFEMKEQILDLTPVARQKFRLVFRVVNPSAGLFGGVGWMVGNVKIYTDEQSYLY